MKWEKRGIPQEMVKDLAARYGCDALTASILLRRGITGGGEIQYFLEDDPRYIRNPFDLPGMEDAVDRILAAREEGEKVLVYGDRDVDGITSTAMLTGYLAKLGLDVSWRLPQGDEPYGLSIKAVEEFAAAYGTLIITVDCGISNVAEAARAKELGVDLIVTDHHNPQEELPDALSIINPKLKDSPGEEGTGPQGFRKPAYPFRDLSGCGVAYKLVSALRFAERSELYGQDICLLNTRPLNESWLVEILKTRNLAVTGRLSETLVPGMVRISDTRIPSFLEGQQILAWDAPLQKRIFSRIFGKGVEIAMLDIAPEIGKEIPQTAGKSLLRLREISRIARYSAGEFTELDLFLSLFTSFIRKREKHFRAEDEADLQLAALGTIADIMPLKDENRIIVRGGLESLKTKPRPGIENLLFKLDLAGKPFDTRDISWQICPAINAAGRMGKPEIAVNLLLEEDPAARDRLAAELITLNNERKDLGEKTWKIAEARAEENLPLYGGKLAFAWGEDILRGVTGLMATRLTKRFGVPALVVSFMGDTVSGSLRSVRGYDLRLLLELCTDLFLDWGGHDYAAGFSMKRSNWDAFLERLKRAADNIELSGEKDRETVQVDAYLPQNYLNPEDIFKVVDRFAPYGEENEPLIFQAQGLRVAALVLLGKPDLKHVKLTLDAGKHKWPAMYWQAAEKVKRDFDLEDRVDLVFTVNRNWFNGIETPQMIVTDLRRTGSV
ncbi:MAG: single-stranded-DNA-specific exonuclease RecJ, partial [Treponema sp.]|nr:single-stranded-DNA-specific exonuclease RecJ [Treponema sp.]